MNGKAPQLLVNLWKVLNLSGCALVERKTWLMRLTPVLEGFQGKTNTPQIVEKTSLGRGECLWRHASAPWRALCPTFPDWWRDGSGCCLSQLFVSTGPDRTLWRQQCPHSRAEVLIPGFHCAGKYSHYISRSVWSGLQTEGFRVTRLGSKPQPFTF